MEVITPLPYSHDAFLPLRSPRLLPKSPARQQFAHVRSHSRKVSSDVGIDEAFWALEEQQKQDRLINVILALLHI